MTKIMTDSGVLIGGMPGGWLVIYDDGTRRMMDDATFLSTFEPEDEQARSYISAVQEEKTHV